MSGGSLWAVARAALDSPSQILPRPRSHFEPLPEARFGETDFANDAASWSELYVPAADPDEFTGVAKLLRSFGLDTLPLGAPEPLADEELNPFAASDEFAPAALDDRPSRAPARAAALPKAIDAPTAANDATEPSAANVDRTGKPQSTLPVPGEPDRSARVTAADPLRIDDEAPGSGPIMAVRRETDVDARRAPAPAERPSAEAASEIDRDERHAARAGAAFDASSAARSTGEILRKDDEARDSAEAPAEVDRDERGVVGPAGAADDRATRDDATRRDAFTAATQVDVAHAHRAEHETPISPHVDDRSAPVTASDLLRIDDDPQRGDTIVPVTRESHDAGTHGDVAHAALLSSTEGSTSAATHEAVHPHAEHEKPIPHDIDERSAPVTAGHRPRIDDAPQRSDAIEPVAREPHDAGTHGEVEPAALPSSAEGSTSAATHEAVHTPHAEHEKPIPHDIDERSAPVTAGHRPRIDDAPQRSDAIEPVAREPHDAATHGEVEPAALPSSAEGSTQLDRTEQGARPAAAADDRATRDDASRHDAFIAATQVDAAHAHRAERDEPIPPHHVDERSESATASDLLRLDDGPHRRDTIEPVTREPHDAGTHGDVAHAAPLSSVEAVTQVDGTEPEARLTGSADDRTTRDDTTRLDAFTAARRLDAFSAATHQVARAPHAEHEAAHAPDTEREDPIPPHDVEDRSAPVTAGDLVRLDDGPQRRDTIEPVSREPHEPGTHGDVVAHALPSSAEGSTQLDRTQQGARPAAAADDRAARDDASRDDAFTAATQVDAAHAHRAERDEPIPPHHVDDRSAPVTVGDLLCLDDGPQRSDTIEPISREPHDPGTRGDVVAHAALPSSTEGSTLDRTEQRARPAGTPDDRATKGDSTRHDAFTAATRLDAFSAATHEAARAPHAEHEAAHAPDTEREDPIPQRRDTIEPVSREPHEPGTHGDVVAHAALPSSTEGSTLDRTEQRARPAGTPDDRATKGDSTRHDAFTAATQVDPFIAATHEAAHAPHAEREDPIPARDNDDLSAPVTAGDRLRLDGPQRSDTIEPVTREVPDARTHRDVVAHAELPSSTEGTQLDHTEQRARPAGAPNDRATKGDSTPLDAFSAATHDAAHAPHTEPEDPIPARDIDDLSAPLTAGDFLRFDDGPQRSDTIIPVTREPHAPRARGDVAHAELPPSAESSRQLERTAQRARPAGAADDRATRDDAAPRDAFAAAAQVDAAHAHRAERDEAIPRDDINERSESVTAGDLLRLDDGPLRSDTIEPVTREVPARTPRDVVAPAELTSSAERSTQPERAGPGARPAGAADDRTMRENATRGDPFTAARQVEAFSAAAQVDAAHPHRAEREAPIPRSDVDDRSEPATTSDRLRLDDDLQRSDTIEPMTREPHDRRTRGDAARAELPSSAEGSKQLDAFSTATREPAHAPLDDGPQRSDSIEPIAREPRDPIMPVARDADVDPSAATRGARFASPEATASVDHAELGARPASNDDVQTSRPEREVSPEQPPRDVAPMRPRELTTELPAGTARTETSQQQTEQVRPFRRNAIRVTYAGRPAAGAPSDYAAPPRGAARLHAATEPPNAAVPLAFGGGSAAVTPPVAAVASIATAAPIAPAPMTDISPAPPDALAPARDALAPTHEATPPSREGIARTRDTIPPAHELFGPAPEAIATPAAIPPKSVSTVRSADASDPVHGVPAVTARDESAIRSRRTDAGASAESALVPDVIRAAPPPAGRREAAPAERTIRVSIDRIEVASPPPPPPRTPVRRRPGPRVTLDAYAERRS